MVRVDATQEEWELLVILVKDHSSAYLASNIIGEIKNQIIRQGMIQ